MGLGESLSQLQLPSTASVSELRCAVACAAGAPRAGDVIVSAGGRPIVGSSLASAGVRAGDFIQARLRICGGAQTAVPGMAVSAQPPAAFGGPAGGASQGASGVTGAPSAGPAGSAALTGGAPTAPQRVALYVGDLAPAVNERTLHQLFSQVAPVQNVRVIRHHITRQSLGYAYVNLHSTADAERCIDMLNYSSLEGRPIRIMFSNRDPSKRRSGKGNLFIKGLPPSFNSKDLHDFFQGYGFGEVVSCKVALDEQGRSKCYGFVQFANDSDATQAIDKANGIRLEDHVITVERYRSKAERGAATAWNNVYVKDIPKNMGAEALKGMFSPYGEVNNAVVMTDAEQKSKGFGFVCFRDGKGARKAVMALHGKLLRDPEVPDAEVAGQESVEQYEKELEGALKGFRRELQAVDDPELAAQIIEEKRARAAGKPTPAAKEGPEEDEEEQKKASPAAGAAGGSGAAGPRKSRRTARTVTTAAAAATIGVPPEETTVIRPPRGYKRLYVGRALKNADRQRQKQARKEREREMRVKQLAGHSVYVRNLDESVDEDTLRAEFRRFGTLTSVKVMRDKTGRSRLFGYVGFTSAEDAMEAIRNMAGRLLYGKPLYVSLWQPREQRRAQIERARSVQMAQAEFMRQAQMMGADLSSPEVLQAAVNFSRIAMGGMPGMGMGMMPGFGMGMGMGGMGMGGGFGMMGGMRGGQGFTQEQMAMMQQQQQAQAAAAQQAQAQAQAAAQQQAQAQQQGGQGQQQGVGFSGQGQQQGGMVGGPVVPQAPGIQASELAKLKPEEQRQQIGERLYHMLEPSQGPRTGKIVGMLLGMEVTELINLLESPDVLAEQVQQANVAIDQQSDGGSAAAKADPAKAGPQ